MYKALYRKYRPERFADVVGQPYIVKALKNQVASGQTGHAYVFTGVRGTGKTTCARILAKAVNCLDPQDGEPCGKCRNCLAIGEGSTLDVCEIDAASNNGVDNVRQLREEVAFAPSELKYRIYIIDEVHMMSGSAFNALLKTLEEPPAHVKFILATTEVHKLPVTILSRCQRYDFRRIGEEDIAGLITGICGKEGIAIEPEAAAVIADAADGAMRDAISMLELCAAEGGAITCDAARKKLGMVSRDYVAGLAEDFADGDASAAATRFEEIYAAGVDCERLCGELLEYYRRMLLCKIGGRAGDPTFGPRDSALLERVSYEHICGCIDEIKDCFERIRRSVSPRLEVQLALSRICRGKDKTPAELSARVAALESKIAALQSAPQNYSQPAAPKPVPITTQTKPAEEEKLPPAAAREPLEQWEQIVSRLCESEKMLRPALEGCRAYKDGERLMISSPNPFFTDILRRDGNSLKLRAAVDAVLGEGHPFKKLGVCNAGGEKAEPGSLNAAEKLAERANELGIKTRL